MASLTLDWLHLIALLGAIQGVFLTGVLAARRKNRTANRLLAAAIFTFSLHLVSAVYLSAGLVPVFPHFFGISYPLTFLYGPLIYLYAVTAADRSRRLAWRDGLHFGPFVATVLAGLPIYLMSGPEKVALFADLQSGTKPLLIRVADPLKFLSGVSYAVLTILFLQRHRDRVKESYSSLEPVNLRWLLWLGGGAAGIWFMALTFQVVESSGIATIPHSDDYVSLAIAVLVYAIGYMGLRQPEVFHYETAEYPIPVAEASEGARLPAELPVEAPRYERSGLSEPEAGRLRSSLEALMEKDRPWQDSELTLADLSQRLGTTPHKLSEVLNTEIGQTFYDFVNGYRVREVQRRIAAGDGHRLTILALALEAGFASKSTFNQVFKKHTGQTPSEYRQTAKA
jgi:AraC-like DNA-binding protein